MPASPTLLTCDEVAALLRTTRAAVYAMVARGQIPVVRVTERVLRFDEAALVEWLRQKRVPSLEGDPR